MFAICKSVDSLPATRRKLIYDLISMSDILSPLISACTIWLIRSSRGFSLRSWMSGIMYAFNSSCVRSPAAVRSGSPVVLVK